MLGSPFDGARLDTVGSVGNRVCSNGVEHLGKEVFLFSGHLVDCADSARPMAQSVEGAFETEAVGGDLKSLCRTEHEVSSQVVADGMHQQLLDNHSWAFTTQVLHLHGDFDVAKTEFNLPAQSVKLRQLLQWITLWIDQAGNEINDACPKA